MSIDWKCSAETLHLDACYSLLLGHAARNLELYRYLRNPFIDNIDAALILNSMNIIW